MSIRPAFLFCAAAGILLSACENSSGPDLPAGAAEAKGLLLAAKWIPSARTISPGFDMEDNGVIVTNVFAIEDACEHDDILRFNADGTWTGDEGADKCDPDDPQAATGDWVLNAAGDSITMTDDSLPGEVKARIAALTSSRLSLTASSDNWPDGAFRDETFTWKAQ